MRSRLISEPLADHAAQELLCAFEIVASGFLPPTIHFDSPLTIGKAKIELSHITLQVSFADMMISAVYTTFEKAEVTFRSISLQQEAPRLCRGTATV